MNFKFLKRMRHYILLAILMVADGGKVPDGMEWMKKMENGAILPELTLEQQMHLVGAKMEPSTTPPTTPWWKTIEDGKLPPIPSEIKQHLFGDNVVMSSAENVNDTRTKGVTEGRAKLKKVVLPILLAMTLIAAIVLPALMTIIKLIAVKGLGAGVVSLIISKLLGLKALLSHHHHSHQDSYNRHPYFVYVPHHGQHRREEEENEQLQRQPFFDQWPQSNWEHRS